MIEPQAGVFVGPLSARIRDRLWEKVVRELRDGSAVLIFAANTEQGFAVRSHGDRDRIPYDHEGLTLVRRRVSGKKR